MVSASHLLLHLPRDHRRERAESRENSSVLILLVKAVTQLEHPGRAVCSQNNPRDLGWSQTESDPSFLFSSFNQEGERDVMSYFGLR